MTEKKLLARVQCFFAGAIFAAAAAELSSVPAHAAMILAACAGLAALALAVKSGFVQ